MASTNAAATRSGVADGKNVTRRIDGRAWREIDRACKIGKKHDAYSVEHRGVRVVFKLEPQSPQVETTGGKAKSTRTSRQRTEPTSASAKRPAKAPNSAQRKSARRMQKYILDWERNLDRNASETATLESTAAGESQADPGERKDRAAPMEAEEERRGQKRAAGEPQASPKSPVPTAVTQLQPQPQPRQTRTVESTAPTVQQARGRSKSPQKRQASPKQQRAAGESPASKPLPAQTQQPAAAKKPAAAALSLARRGVEPTPAPTPFQVPPWPHSGKGGGNGGGFIPWYERGPKGNGYGGGGYGGGGYGGRGYGDAAHPLGKIRSPKN